MTTFWTTIPTQFLMHYWFIAGFPNQTPLAKHFLLFPDEIIVVVAFVNVVDDVVFVGISLSFLIGF